MNETMQTVVRLSAAQLPQFPQLSVILKVFAVLRWLLQASSSRLLIRVDCECWRWSHFQHPFSYRIAVFGLAVKMLNAKATVVCFLLLLSSAYGAFTHPSHTILASWTAPILNLILMVLSSQCLKLCNYLKVWNSVSSRRLPTCNDLPHQASASDI